MQFSVI